LGSCGEMILDRLSLGLIPDAFNKIYPPAAFNRVKRLLYFLLKLLAVHCWSELLSVAIVGYLQPGLVGSSNCVDYEARSF